MYHSSGKSKADTSSIATFICIVTKVENILCFFLILLSSLADLLLAFSKLLHFILPKLPWDQDYYGLKELAQSHTT